MKGRVMAEDQGTAMEAGSAPPTGAAWARLLRMTAVLTILLMVIILVLAGEFIPPFALFFVLLLVGLFLLPRGGKAGPIVFIVTFVLFLVLNAPFVIPTLFVPASTVDFIIGVVSILLGIVGLIAAIAVLRGRDAAPSSAPRKVGLVMAVVFVLSIVVGVGARATYEEPTRGSDDIELTTADTEFSPDSLEAGAGEVTVFVTNEDGTLHTFTIDDLDVDLAIPAGTSARVTFDAEPGTYEFYCVPHQPDMDGELTIQ